MITRSAKRKSMHLECNSLVSQVPSNEILIQSQSISSVESSGYIRPGNEQLQKSICSIHIHLPAHEFSTIKLSLSGIQPLINIYPNKVHNALEFNTGSKSRKVTQVLDDMELPFENNLQERSYLELESSTTSQRCLIDNVSEGTNENKNSRSENIKGSNSSKKSNGNKSYKNNDHKTYKNSKEISSYTYDKNSIKLNKAVVVLTDICRTKYYKSAFIDHIAKDRVKNCGIETKKDSSPVLKQENLKRGTQIIDNCCTSATDSAFDIRPSLESVNTTPLRGSRLLTQLAEGCSFSEILNRFRIKNGNCLVDTLKPADSINHENFNTECLEFHDNHVLKSETCSLNEDEEDTVDGFLMSEVTEKINSKDFEDSNMLDLPQSSDYEESKEDIEHLKDESWRFHLGSDHNENTTAVQSVSGDVSADKETVDSSSLTSNVVCGRSDAATSEETCNISETSRNDLSNMNNPDLNLHESEQPNLEMDKEEMEGKKFLDTKKGKRKKNKRSKSTTEVPSHPPSPKKMRQSDQKSKTFHEKSELPDDYVPLQTSGPTKFGVATLNQIKPYVGHEAKDFKNKMLFGERNKRVSSPRHLQIYKLKQQVNRSIRG